MENSVENGDFVLLYLFDCNCLHCCLFDVVSLSIFDLDMYSFSSFIEDEGKNGLSVWWKEIGRVVKVICFLMEIKLISLRLKSYLARKILA